MLPDVSETGTQPASSGLAQAGMSARVNLFGAAIVEVFYAVRFQRPDKGGFVGVNLLSGW